jgi:iron-sulfur cluster assembly protein
MITLTTAAIEHLQELLRSQNAAPGVGLRLQIERGGCAGMQYAMRLDSPHEGDEVVVEGGVSVFVGPDSMGFLLGSTLDYVESLNDSGFKIENPNAERSCGCGTSFEPKKEG